MKKRPWIRVFVTKLNKFEARIQEFGKPMYRVIIGGKEWRRGKGQKHSEMITIMIKCILIDLLGEAGKENMGI